MQHNMLRSSSQHVLMLMSCLLRTRRRRQEQENLVNVCLLAASARSHPHLAPLTDAQSAMW
jgi:hypothetical protein